MVLKHSCVFIYLSPPLTTYECIIHQCIASIGGTKGVWGVPREAVITYFKESYRFSVYCCIVPCRDVTGFTGKQSIAWMFIRNPPKKLWIFHKIALSMYASHEELFVHVSQSHCCPREVWSRAWGRGKHHWGAKQRFPVSIQPKTECRLLPTEHRTASLSFFWNTSLSGRKELCFFFWRHSLEARPLTLYLFLYCKFDIIAKACLLCGLQGTVF